MAGSSTLCRHSRHLPDSHRHGLVLAQAIAAAVPTLPTPCRWGCCGSLRWGHHSSQAHTCPQDGRERFKSGLEPVLAVTQVAGNDGRVCRGQPLQKAQATPFRGEAAAGGETFQPGKVSFVGSSGSVKYHSVTWSPRPLA